VRWADGTDPSEVASAMAACVIEAVARRGEASEPSSAGDPVMSLPGSVTAEQIQGLPEGPGVYRFFDAAGNLLYVGKAANLRRRVGSYFIRGRRSRHGAGFLPRIDRLEHRTLGTELEALLLEARSIERQGPACNVQVQVHERGLAYGAARRWALLMPHRDGRRVTAVFVHDGRYAGHVVVGPRGGGLAKARGLMGPVRAGRGARAGAGRKGADRDTEILTSWLARYGDDVSRLELDSFPTRREASAALAKAVRAVLSEGGASVFRGSVDR
ncbi:MAG TPA: nucleotide excision repair endonuclease, partial [Candidatus Polarisedimenticolia bacterium]|nr:nucleotide excision repair endonuclease [Candidatus Polarisedimenticolia bacterium]